MSPTALPTDPLAHYALLTLVALGIIALFIGTLILLRFQLDYHISKSHMVITLLGVPIRRVALVEIDRISKRKAQWSENWINTLNPNHRRLVIHRRYGLFKALSISPQNRYVFKADLESAVALASHESAKSLMDQNKPLPRVNPGQASPRHLTSQEAIDEISKNSPLSNP